MIALVDLDLDALALVVIDHPHEHERLHERDDEPVTSTVASNQRAGGGRRARPSAARGIALRKPPSGEFGYCTWVDANLVFAVLRALERHRVAYKIVGGVALNLIGLARATKGLDIFVDPTPDNIARLRGALHSVLDDPSIDEISAGDLSGEYPAVQYVPPEGEFHVDILARLGEAFAYHDIETEQREVEGMRLPVATPRMLHRMKRDTVRAQDRADAERLRLHFRWEE